MIELILVGLLAAGPGAIHRSGPPQPHFTLTSSGAAAVNGRTLSSFLSTVDAEIASLSVTMVVPGAVTNPGDVVRVSALVDGVEKCFVEVACDATLGDYVASCSDAPFSVGQDLDVAITAMPCSVAPSIFQTTDAIQN